MLSMNEVNQMLKDNFQRQLSEIKQLPEDLARGYKKWIRTIVNQASQKLVSESMSQEEPTSQEG